MTERITIKHGGRLYTFNVGPGERRIYLNAYRTRRSWSRPEERRHARDSVLALLATDYAASFRDVGRDRWAARV